MIKPLIKQYFDLENAVKKFNYIFISYDSLLFRDTNLVEYNRIVIIYEIIYQFWNYGWVFLYMILYQIFSE